MSARRSTSAASAGSGDADWWFQEGMPDEMAQRKVASDAATHGMSAGTVGRASVGGCLTLYQAPVQWSFSEPTTRTQIRVPTRFPAAHGGITTCRYCFCTCAGPS